MKSIHVISKSLLILFCSIVLVSRTCNAHAQDHSYTARENWKSKFYDVYQLNNEHVKRIPKPYIPERQDYFFTKFKKQSTMFQHDSVTLLFHWNGNLKNWGLYPDSFKFSLQNVLSYALSIPGYQYEGPPELLQKELDGDWIVRHDASIQKKLKGLESIIKSTWKKDIRFEQKTVERDIYIARGDYSPSFYFWLFQKKNQINVFSHLDEQNETTGGGSGTFKLFLESLSNRFHSQIFDETNASGRQVQWRWRQAMPEEPQKELSESIENITHQTGIAFIKEKRTIPVWFIVESRSEFKNP